MSLSNKHTLVKNKMTENSFPRINIRTIDLSHGDTFFYLSFLKAMPLNSNVDHYFHNWIYYHVLKNIVLKIYSTTKKLHVVLKEEDADKMTILIKITI